ncbi:MAG TPA: hypothetical protein VH969_07255 [Actinophytocola sp.]|jgi:hypothetical protein|uniref:hypothetical protein n=1 Tax=Actinophytocola sp. TaxID=1872138 RepID=UPI002F92D693
MKERLLADLDARIARHANGDSSGVLEARALDLVVELTALGEPDAGSLGRVAALHLCRYQALPPDEGEIDRRMAQALYTNLHTVDPRLVPPDVRLTFGLMSPRDTGLALLAEHERTGQLELLDRAISLFRQETLEHRADGRRILGLALLRRFEQTAELSDVDEAVAVLRETVAAAGPGQAQRDLAAALSRRYEQTGDSADLAEVTELRRAVPEG